MDAESFIRRQIYARTHGKILDPVAEPRTFEPLPVTFRYGITNAEAGIQWQAGHHTGEDHACPDGSLAVAVSWGVVVAAGPGTSYGPSYGNVVVVRTRNGRWDALYAHLRDVRAKVGQSVRPGQILGHTGHSGFVTGSHLHFECRPAGGRYGSDVDPVHVKKGHPIR